jgi:RNA polymerase-binding transcription factor DksA
MPTPDVPHPDLAASLPLLQQMLEEQRQFRLTQLAELAVEADNLVRPVGDRGDAAAEAARREVVAALATGARQALDDAESALARMRAGRYGTCQGCSGQISLDRLYVVPQTGMCVDCQCRIDLLH